MKIEGDKIVMDKDEYVVNTLLTGIAVQILVDRSKFSMEQWMEFLSNKADEQLEEIKRTRPEQIDQMIEMYVNASNPKK